MKDLLNILSEAKRYTFKGDYLIRRNIEDLDKRHICTFTGELAYLSNGVILGLLKDNLDSRNENLILGLLNDNKLQFYEFSNFTRTRRVYNLILLRQTGLNFEGRSQLLTNFSEFNEMVQDIYEIKQAYIKSEKKYDFEHLLGIERKRLEKYFQNSFMDNIALLGSLSSITLNEIETSKFQN